ncbi:MAG: restriction endonuclease [Phycisphaerales bacterium]|nr:restriction endonuclease [Hyphomonadaceae bacterium]
MDWHRHLPPQLIDCYEVHNFRHAAEVLATAYPAELAEVVAALSQFQLTTKDILDPGGNESGITKRFRDLLRPNGWLETKVTADLLVRRAVGRKAQEEDDAADPELIRRGYIEGHKVDFVKGSVALDFEWNSKDQTFDRDLYALRTFYECGVIAAGVLVTRSESLNTIFKKLGVQQKYGASTTWMGKLLPRLDAGRNGGCPVLVLGITPRLVTDWSEPA